MSQLEKLIKMFMEKFSNYSSCHELRREWLPKHEVQEFLGYGDTQMSTITKNYNLVLTEIGKKKFYSLKSLQKVFEKNIL